jgi:hypothetical protein
MKSFVIAAMVSAFYFNPETSQTDEGIMNAGRYHISNIEEKAFCRATKNQCYPVVYFIGDNGVTAEIVIDQQIFIAWSEFCSGEKCRKRIYTARDSLKLDLIRAFPDIIDEDDFVFRQPPSIENADECVYFESLCKS